MSKSIEDSITAYSLSPRIEAYDLIASFGYGQLGRSKKRVLSSGGKEYLEIGEWEAGDVAYQYLSRRYQVEVNHNTFRQLASDSLTMADEFYIELKARIAEGHMVMMINGVDSGLAGLSQAWDSFDWCERVLLLIEATEQFAANNDVPVPEEVGLQFNEIFALVLLQRLDDAVIEHFCDGRGLTDLVLEISSLKDRLKPPLHVLRAIDLATKVAEKEVMAKAIVTVRSSLAKDAAQVRHSKSRFHKQMVFEWCDKNMDRFGSMDDASLDIAETFVPEKFRAVREWMTDWKKLRSASKP
jgi:hypothetical protein